MKKAQILYLTTISLFLLCSCSSKGTITIINTNLDKDRVVFNEKNIALSSEQHFTQKNLEKGIYKLKINDTPEMDISINKNQTTVVDISGDNCFVVADYTDQYGSKGTGHIKILDKFINKKVFSVKQNLSAELGEPLPQEVKGNKNITRLHRIDCAWINDDETIIDALSNLP